MSKPATKRDSEQRLAGEGGTDDEKLAHEDTERGKAGDRDDAKHETPAKHGVGFSQSPISAIFCVPLVCAM